MSIDDQSEDDRRFAADLLRGAAAIAAFLNELGETDVTSGSVYYLRKAKKYPIGRHAGELIASKRQLARHARKISNVA
jgi:hypothetical protein